MVIRLLLAVLMTIIGGLLYIFTRQGIVFFRVISDSIINQFNNTIIDCSSTFQYIIVYCLPDGLWYGALILFQSVFLNNTIISKTIFGVSILLPFIWELLQLMKVLPGTFDPFDVVVCFFTLIILILCQKIKDIHIFK